MKKIACILLAAGKSSRMLGPNKLMLKLGGESVIKKAGSAIQHAEFAQKILVVSDLKAETIAEVRDFDFEITPCKNAFIGMHASIRSGIMALKKDIDAFFICFADQPFLTPGVFHSLIQTAGEHARTDLFYPVAGGERKQPVLIGADFIPEILAHEDGDFGCSYLMKNHPELCHSVKFTDEKTFRDIDTPGDFRKNQMDPAQALHEVCLALRKNNQAHVIATVIETLGSSSARPGSKAVFDESGTNLIGWVGGGCAEEYVKEQSLEALKENQARIVDVDMDDELYGLGVVCGGKMRIFLEPILPPESITLKTNHSAEAIFLGKRYGWNVIPVSGDVHQSMKELIVDLARAVGSQRNKSGNSLRELRSLPVSFQNSNSKPASSKRVTIVGKTRITEALEEHFTLLGFEVRTVGPFLKPYGDEEGEEINFESGEKVIVASHTSRDPHLVAKILKSDISYVGMVGSRTRAVELLKILGLKEGSQITKPLYIPAGLDIDAKNPEEIALSIAAECMLLERS